MKNVRQCGGCTACCSTHEVFEINKPSGQRCQYCPGAGCLVYEERPLGCTAFSCQWLLGFGTENDRPDKTGLVLDYWPLLGLGKVGILFEVTSGAIQATKGEELSHLIAGRLPLLHWFFNQEKVLYLPLSFRVNRKLKKMIEGAGIVIRSVCEL